MAWAWGVRVVPPHFGHGQHAGVVRLVIGCVWVWLGWDWVCWLWWVRGVCGCVAGVACVARVSVVAACVEVGVDVCEGCVWLGVWCGIAVPLCAV